MLSRLRRKTWVVRDRLMFLLTGSEHTGNIFTRIRDDNLWGDPESVSGFGSSLESTVELRAALPALMVRYGLKSILDAPCGDFNWMREVVDAFDSYVGVDIVPGLIEANRRRFSRQGVQFICADITRGPLPDCDIVLCRDCFIHLPSWLIRDSITQFRRTGARFLLMTNTASDVQYHEIPIGGFRPINFRSVPFHYPEPLEIIVEDASSNRQLCLWSFDQIPD